MSNNGWAWYSGHNNETFNLGPFHSRDEAIEAARQDALGEFLDEAGGKWKVGVHIVEARKDPLRLADWVGADWVLERADESICDSDRVGADGDDGPWFAATKEQEADLEARIRRACDEWQEAHGLVFTTFTFSAVRNAEFLVVPHPNDAAAA